MEIRFENKFVFNKGDLLKLKSLIFNGSFRKIYDDRTVHSIYYDNVNYDSLYDNINGLKNRIKYRIRWYNEIKDTEVFFEKKIKSGLITKKIKIRLGSFSNYKNLLNYLKSVDFKKKILDFTRKNLFQILKVSYQRSYYSDYLKKIRLTFDKNITVKKNIKLDSKLSSYELDSNVLELKYSIKDSQFVKNKIKEYNLNLRNQKFSKYVRSFILLSDIGYHWILWKFQF